MTKAEQVALAALGLPTKKQVPVISSSHPFLVNVLRFMTDEKSWCGTISELLIAIGDGTTHPTTASKLLHKYDIYMLKNYNLKITFKRYNCARMIEIVTVE